MHGQEGALAIRMSKKDEHTHTGTKRGTKIRLEIISSGRYMKHIIILPIKQLYCCDVLPISYDPFVHCTSILKTRSVTCSES